MRVAVLKEDNCQPKKCNDECFHYCPPVRNGQECIVMDEKTGKPHISESLCIGCGICINKCPHDALIIEQLPSELETDMIHRYSLNGFRLFRLPTPTKESVVGIFDNRFNLISNNNLLLKPPMVITDPDTGIAKLKQFQIPYAIMANNDITVFVEAF